MLGHVPGVKDKQCSNAFSWSQGEVACSEGKSQIDTSSQKNIVIAMIIACTVVYESSEKGEILQGRGCGSRHLSEMLPEEVCKLILTVLVKIIVCFVTEGTQE